MKCPQCGYEDAVIEARGIDKKIMDNMEILQRFFDLGIQGKSGELEKLYREMKETGFFNTVVV